ncbi:hypothetical protein PUN28_007482 [Cardiocondyla obscurior]|uniref:Uncharacterized protein n=1 Tax=Cardiocondyla obscurior TaxID=286306 RepID=A0AAW2G580_9HYME
MWILKIEYQNFYFLPYITFIRMDDVDIFFLSICCCNVRVLCDETIKKEIKTTPIHIIKK